MLLGFVLLLFSTLAQIQVAPVHLSRRQGARGQSFISDSTAKSLSKSPKKKSKATAKAVTALDSSFEFINEVEAYTRFSFIWFMRSPNHLVESQPCVIPNVFPNQGKDKFSQLISNAIPTHECIAAVDLSDGPSAGSSSSAGPSTGASASPGSKSSAIQVAARKLGRRQGHISSLADKTLNASDEGEDKLTQ
ncbi:hypothetical protein BC833DRAFT_619174 [Globomyces pollinis-pini]|nr:hypothetical protein BC833DRAFT_619174 [Globomyces pollinis-pini]